MPRPAHEYYATLGVLSTASAEEIRIAYERLAAQCRTGSAFASERFEDVKEAYFILSDPDARLLYDEATFAAASGSAETGSGPAASADPHPARGFGSASYTDWTPAETISEATQIDAWRFGTWGYTGDSSAWPYALFAVGGICFFVMLSAFPLPEALVGPDLSDNLVMVTVLFLIAAGYLMGGTAGNRWLRAALIDAGIWCCAVPYWRIALKLQWPVIEHLLPWALMTYLWILAGVYSRHRSAKRVSNHGAKET